MPDTTSIQYLRNSEIDRSRWDHCIDGASNGLVYAYSTYLDAMCTNWDALVLNDYEMVMPLPWRKKYGFQYIYQPAFTAQLGVFGKNISLEIFQSFLRAVPAKFQYWFFSLNHQNNFKIPGYPVYERSNYFLRLNNDYSLLYADYSENIKRNIKKAVSNKCSIQKEISIKSIIDLAKNQGGGATTEDYTRFEKAYNSLQEKGMTKSYGVKVNDKLLASAVFLLSNNRAYYLLVGNHPEGRSLGASHFLIDWFIKDHAGQELILDFEGSDLVNLQFFYSGFGAVEEKYAAIKLNRLPWYVKWLKKS